MSQLDELRKRILKEQEFREQLVKDPHAALKSVGIASTPQNVALIKNVIDSIENLYSAFEEKDRFVT
jgi:hypothetical protein